MADEARMTEGPTPPVGGKECEQCGRRGTRGFKTLGPVYLPSFDSSTPEITVCAARKACQRRWPHQLRTVSHAE